MAAGETKATLYSFGLSHYCEKARWSLDLCGVPYREVRWAPGPHVFAARRIAARSSVPILACGDSIIQGSCAIMDWLEASGRAPWRHQTSPGQGDDIARLTARANDGLAIALRRYFYATGLSSEPTGVARQMFAGASWPQRSAAWLMWPLTRQLIKRGMRATASDIPPARAEVEQELDALDTILADGRRFLVGDHLTRADIATASLLSPIAWPPRHPSYRGVAPWAALQRIIDTYRDRPCVRWTAQLYEDYRYSPVVESRTP